MSPRCAKSFGDKAPGGEQRISHADKANMQTKPTGRQSQSEQAIEANRRDEPDRRATKASHKGEPDR
jgi:hypothetical protein